MRCRSWFLLLLSGCSALTAQIDEPEICESILAPFLPATDGGEASFDAELSISLPSALDQQGAASEVVQLEQVTFAPGDGGALGTLDAAEVDVLDPSGAADQAGYPALDYASDPSVPQAAPLVLSGTGLNLSPYIHAGKLALRVHLVGAISPEAVPPTAQICVQVSATVNYAELGTNGS